MTLPEIVPVGDAEALPAPDEQDHEEQNRRCGPDPSDHVHPLVSLPRPLRSKHNLVLPSARLAYLFYHSAVGQRHDDVVSGSRT